MSLPKDSGKPIHVSGAWDEAHVRPVAEAESLGYTSFEESATIMAVGKDKVMDRVLRGHIEVIPVGPDLESIYLRRSILDQKRFPKGVGPYYNITWRMLAPDVREDIRDRWGLVPKDASGTNGFPNGNGAGRAPASARDALARQKSILGGATTGAAAVEVQVWKRQANGTDAYLATRPVPLTPDQVRHEWGHGDYLFKFIVGGREDSSERVPVAALDGSMPASGPTGKANDIETTLIEKMLLKDDGASQEGLLKGLAEHTKANAEAMKMAAEIGGGHKGGGIAEIQAAMAGLLQAQQQAHAQMMETLQATTQATLDRIQAQAEATLKIERERAANELTRERERAERERERERERMTQDRERDQKLLTTMREADVKVEEAWTKLQEQAARGIERDQAWIERMRSNEERHIEEVRALKSENPDEKTMALFGSVLAQVDQTAGRILHAKYGVDTSGTTRASINGNGNGNGNGHAKLPPPAQPPAATGVNRLNGIVSQEGAPSVLNLLSAKKQFLKSEDFHALLAEANKHVAGGVGAHVMAGTIVNLSHVADDPKVNIALNFLASVTMRELLTQAECLGTYPALETDAGHAWFEDVKARLFSGKGDEGEVEARAAGASA